MPSPTPISLIGIPSSDWRATTTPPFAVPSSFVSAIPVMSVASLKVLAWLIAFWPVVESRTNRFSRFASG